MSLQSRRTFLNTASLVGTMAVCGTFPRLSLAASAERPRLGIQLYSLRGFKRDEEIKYASELGF